jgi:two-component system, NtrC family, sensor histidine kinase HydH
MLSVGTAYLRDRRFQIAFLALTIIAFAAMPWFVPTTDVEAHNILHHLNFIPLMCAGMLLGWRGSLAAALFAGAVHAPYLLRAWNVSHFDASDQVVELSIFAVAGLIAGFLSDRERAQRTKAEKASAELARVYGELESNVERLKKAERLYAAGRLSTSLAHEIRNPLISISGAAGILKRAQASPENITECLDIIDKESKRLNKLLTNFLDFARPRTPKFQWADLNEVVTSVTAVVTHAMPTPNVTIRHLLATGIPEVQCDPEQLKQVLLNLVINAIQASPPGASVTVSTEWSSDFVNIRVQDEGCGVQHEQREQIFEPFFTTKQNGTGLGLAIASMIVSQHGGALTANQNAERGMTFRVELPCSGKQIE